MKAPFRSWLAVGLVTLLSMGAAHAQGALSVFSGSLQVLSLGSWGNGSARLDRRLKYLEKPTLAVNTRDYFEGAYLQLQQPVDLTPYVTNKDNGLIVLVVQFPQPAAPEAAPGMAPGMPPGGAPGPPPPPPMMGGPPPPGMPGAPAAAAAPPETLDHLRVVLITDKGPLDSGALLAAAGVTPNPKWLRLVVPLSSCAAPADLTGAQLLGVAVTGNTEGTFNLGQLYLKVDNPPLVAQIQGDRVLTVARREPVNLTAAPQQGDLPADYTWDFDFSNGLGTDALGPTATAQYNKPGAYVVTVLVSDPTGARETRVDQILVVVHK
jgi:hypothetical protein